MTNYIQLVTQLLRNLKAKKDLTFLIATKDKHTAMISVKEGEISYLRFGSLVGVEALSSLQQMEVESFSERKHSLEHPKSKVALPSTQDILQQLSVKLPGSLREYQSNLAPLEAEYKVANAVNYSQSATMVADVSELSTYGDNSSVEDSRLIVPVEPKSSEISDSMIQSVKTALQRVLGPISDFIYEDAFAEVSPVNNRNDLTSLINALLEEIDEIQYQKQFLKLVEEQLIGIVVVMH